MWYPSSRLDFAAGATAAGLVLAPYLTVALPFRLSLYLQAALVVAIVVAAAGVGLRAGGAECLGKLSPWFIGGVSGWVVALLVGASVAIIRGNDATYLLGQVISLVLVPLGALTGILLGGARRLPPFAVGTVAAVALATCFHLVHWVIGAVRGTPVFRLYMDNAISIVGPALPGLMFAMALLVAGVRPSRTVFGTFLLIGIYVVGSGTRGLWLAVSVGTIGYLALSPAARRLLRRPSIWWTATISATLAAAGIVGFWVQIQGRRGDLFRSPAVAVSTAVDIDPAQHGPVCGTTNAGGSSIVAEGIEVEPRKAYRLFVQPTSWEEAPDRIWVEWLDRRSRRLSYLEARVPKSGSDVSFGVAPAGTMASRVRVFYRPRLERWCLETRLDLLGPGYLAPIVQQVQVLQERASSLLARTTDDDPSMSFRRTESRKILEEVARAPWPLVLWGHGLGATFRLDVQGYDNRGNLVYYGDVNYIHNFYLFLLFKLGILGTLVTLASLGVFAWLVGVSWRRAEGVDRELRASVLAALVAALVWSFFSPVVQDFRLAPLWGVFIATAGHRQPE